MNVAAATTYASTTYDLCLFSAFEAPVTAPTPTDTFVSKQVANLATSFPLDADQQELAELLLFGRTIGAIARKLGVSTSETQRRCAAVFAATHTDGRQQLFELGLRLTTMRELSNYLIAAM